MPLQDIFAEIYTEIDRIKDRLSETRESVATMHTDDGIPTHTASEGVLYWDYANDDLYVNSNGVDAWQIVGGGSSAAAHNVLSATHLDSSAAAVTRGALITGQGASPAWARLDHPSAIRRYLQSNASEPSWVANITLDDTAWIGNGSTQLRIEFDTSFGDIHVHMTDAAGSDKLFITDSGGTDVAHIDSNGAMWLDDSLIVNGTSTDSLYEAVINAIDGDIGISTDGGPATFHTFCYGADAGDFPIWRGRRGRGTRASPAAVQSGDILARVGGGGYDGNDVSNESMGHMQVEATETWNVNSYGTAMKFRTTPNGSTAYQDALVLGQDGIGYFEYGVRTIWSEANVSDPPTDAELDAAFGTPATVGEGFIALVDDNNANTTTWLVFSLGGSWWYEELTKAT